MPEDYSAVDTYEDLAEIVEELGDDVPRDVKERIVQLDDRGSAVRDEEEVAEDKDKVLLKIAKQISDELESAGLGDRVREMQSKWRDAYKKDVNPNE